MKLLKKNAMLIAFAVVMFAIAGYLLWTTTQPPELPLATTPLTSPKPPPPGETAQGGHWHGSEWHATPHETHQTPVEVQPKQPPAPAAPRGIPFSNFSDDPKEDPVKAAYRRLEYIANNLHEWGEFSPLALEYIDELTPVPVISVEAEGYREIEFLEGLCELRDPRSAEILVSYQVDSPVNGRLPDETLVAMGPGAVPALVARLDEKSASEALLYTPITLLPRIVAEHRSELGGIVEHIIIPKLQAIVANESAIIDNKSFARKAIAKLQQ